MAQLAMIEKISRYIDAGFPVLYINTFEELQATQNIIYASGNKCVLEWSYADGLIQYKDGKILQQYKNDCSRMPLNHVLPRLLMREMYDLTGKILLIKDVHHYLDDVEVISLFKQMINRISTGEDYSIIFLSPILKIPKEIEKFVTIIEDEYMDYEEICEVINDFIQYQNLPKIGQGLLEDIAMSFKGLTKSEITNLLALAYSDDGELNRKDLQLIFEQKKQMILKSGILEMISVRENIGDIGGLENLKKWLIKKSIIIKNINEAKKFGVDAPKGVLIAGVPGCGKSLNAKVAAKLFEIPLLRLDMGRLMGKYVGESESNLRKAISLSEAIAPCVLWIDEIEKAFSGVGSSGSEVTTRLFGNFLTWMQEKESSVFVVATANNILALPPELMRKGRFDEIFFVGLPNKEERKKIFQIHLSKRRKADCVNIDVEYLASRTEGYSGADIEGVVKDAVEDVFVSGRSNLTTNDVARMIENTHSLSEIMKEPLEKMNKEYKERKLKNASI